MQGTLNNYERCLIEFTFSPRTHPSSKGWNHNRPVPSARDYSVLMKFVVTNKLPDCDYEGKKLGFGVNRDTISFAHLSAPPY